MKYENTFKAIDQIQREKARKEWEERPQILYTPMGNRR